VAFLDSDDYWPPEKLGLQMTAFGNQPAVDCVFGRVQFFLDPGGTLPEGFRPEVLQGTHATPCSGATMVKRSLVDRIGPFDERLSIAGDIDWVLNVRDRGTVGWVDQVLLHKRLHAGNLGHVTGRSAWHADLLTIARRRIAAASTDPATMADRSKTSA
jgi:GT2 family glycosyltransferase